jgi:hypothetical protein
MGATWINAGEIDGGMTLCGDVCKPRMDEEQPVANTTQKSALTGRRSDFIKLLMV